MKKIMMLGGNYFQATAIKAAKELGHYVISVDYLPDNPGHKFSDEYHNISTVDKEAVLKLAQELKIDGIVSYASDVSAPTAAYVAENMGLLTNPYESVMILTHKDLFRPFIEKHGFNCPKSKGFGNYEEALEFFKTLSKPVMVKPSDSNGSKGAAKVTKEEEFKGAFDKAMSFSRQKIVIVEDFLVRDGHQIAGDGFIVDGELVFTGFMSEHFDKLCNPLVPIGESYPAYISDELKQKAKSEINRLMKLLNMKFGAINMDFIIDAKGDVYIIEIGPRNGGNLITDAIKEATGIDLAKATVQAALGLEYDKTFKATKSNFIASYITHALRDGTYIETKINDKIKDDILLFEDLTQKGAKISAFDNAALDTGAMLIKFDSIEEMVYRMDNMEEFITVEVE
ncbi:MAG: ATP-grasp domain-containing protein [Ruminococcaceae bacterium]|nr:ATP-grasp domain-containing protein [Oscillospiraceae bacterium]